MNKELFLKKVLYWENHSYENDDGRLVTDRKNEKTGRLLDFGIDGEYSDEAGISFSTALILDDQGEIRNVDVKCVRFVDEVSGETTKREDIIYRLLSGDAVKDALWMRHEVGQKHEPLCESCCFCVKKKSERESEQSK